MSDRAYFSVLGLAAVAMIVVALVWPQGFGARSPGPFGHEPVRPAKAAPVETPSLLPIPPVGATTIPQAPAELPVASSE